MTCFNPEFLKEDEVFTTMVKVHFQTKKDYLANSFGTGYPEVSHLCPNCSKQLQTFMENRDELVDISLLKALQEDYDALLKEKEAMDLEKNILGIDGDRDGDFDFYSAFRRQYIELSRRIPDIVSRLRNSKASERQIEPKQESDDRGEV